MLGRVGKPRGHLAGRGFRPTFPLQCTMPQCWCLLCFPWVPAQALSALSGALPAACWWLRSGCHCLSGEGSWASSLSPCKMFWSPSSALTLELGCWHAAYPPGAHCQLWPWTTQCQDVPPGPTADMPCAAAGLVLLGRKMQRT